MEKDEQELSELENEEFNNNEIQDSSELNNESLEDSSYQNNTIPTSNRPIDTIKNSVNSFKNNYKNNKETINRLNEARNKGRLSKNGISSNDDQISDEIEQKENLEKEEQIQNASRSIKTRTALQSAASTKKTKDMSDKAIKLVNIAKKKKTFIAIGVVGGFILFIIILCAIFINSDDESETSIETNGYFSDKVTEKELLYYLNYISVCPTVDELIRDYEDITFENLLQQSELVESCKNAIKFYVSLKFEYQENKKSCYENRNEGNNIYPDYWNRGLEPVQPYDLDELKQNEKAKDYFINHQNDPDCQIKIPTQLIFETMSYNLTDLELFDKNYLNVFDSYETDNRRLVNALSEFVHETCYVWVYVDAQGRIHDGPCQGCTKQKYAKDGYYFQVSFDKYVCYLKYGDSCEHPNYSGLAREKFPDLKYLEHECGSPQSDKFSYSVPEEDNGVCWKCEACATRTYFYQEDRPATCCTKVNLTKNSCNDDNIEGTCWKCENGNEVSYNFTEKQPSGTCTSSQTKKGFCQGTYDKNDVNVKVIDFAMQFLGTPYVWGGTSLTNGADCSGFTLSVFKQFGIALPHGANMQRAYGEEVPSIDLARPGDLLCFEGHVGIYVGEGKMIHASSAKGKITVTSLADREIITIRRLVS